ncbi:Epsin-like protein [Phytophthora cinnamomi]|uniref:Epsin-like protein n=1 Tax=Phytophthora cinnamomi TaxID=4785 RepID=UPI003559DEE6|nr:Epsin-like protein [Phytophthora cinnamomi]
MDRLRAAFDEVVDIVKSALNGEPKTPAEILLDEHLPTEEDVLASLMSKNRHATGIPTSVMNELASRTNNVVDCPCIQARIWEILIDHQQNPALMKKALNLLQYLLINGSQEVLKDTRSPARASFLIELAAEYNKYEFEQYEFSQNLDVGAGVRKTAAEINTLLEDDDVLLQARQKAQKLHQDLSSRGLRSAYPVARADSPTRAGMSFHDESRPPAYTSMPNFDGRGNDDIGSRIITHPPSDSEDNDEER